MSTVYNLHAHDLFPGRSVDDHFTVTTYALGVRVSVLAEPVIVEGDPGPYNYVTLLPDVEVVKLRNQLTGYLAGKGL